MEATRSPDSTPHFDRVNRALATGLPSARVEDRCAAPWSLSERGGRMVGCAPMTPLRPRRGTPAHAVAIMGVAALVLGATFPPNTIGRARAIRDRALADDTAYETLRSLTTEVGPRLAGSPGDARAVTWAVARLRALGFQNVHTEPVKVPHWIRGEAHAEIVAPWPQTLAAVALGGSVATAPAGVEAEVVRVGSLEELAKFPRERIE